MHCMTVLYPNKEGAKFDFEYSMQKHIPLANGLLGHEFKVSRGMSSAQVGQPPFLCIADGHWHGRGICAGPHPSS